MYYDCKECGVKTMPSQEHFAYLLDQCKTTEKESIQSIMICPSCGHKFIVTGQYNLDTENVNISVIDYPQKLKAAEWNKIRHLKAFTGVRDILYLQVFFIAIIILMENIILKMFLIIRC